MSKASDEHGEGYCSGYTVYLDDGEYSPVLGPDGEPVKIARRAHPVGFDLTHRKGRG